MPQFFFAVGFAFRLTFGRRAQTDGLAAAYWHMVRRMLGLALVAMVIYNVGRTAGSPGRRCVDKGSWEALRGPLKGTWFQTLMHIAVTSLWILPVIRAGALVRVAYMIASAALAGVAVVLVLFRLGAHRRHRRRRAGLSCRGPFPRSSARWPATP